MAEPFQNSEIDASEPLYYTYRKTDHYITRYCALLAMNDPLCLWLGNYDRYCVLTGKWTEVLCKEEDRGGYLKLEFPNPHMMPTIGANGFFIRREILQKYSIGDYLFDIDIIYDLALSGGCKVAKVKTGVIHLYCNSITQFIRKQKRRVRDYNYYKSLGLRKFPWDSIKKTGLVRFCVFTLFTIPLLFQMFKGIKKSKDIAFIFHPIACWLTFLTYSYNTLSSKILRKSAESRKEW